MIIRSSGYAGSEVFPTKSLSTYSAYALEHNGSKALQYGPRQGLEPLRLMLRDWLVADGFPSIQIENLAILSGAKQVIDLACRAFTKPGDTILTSSPTYMNGLKILWAAELKTGVFYDFGSHRIYTELLCTLNDKEGRWLNQK